MNYVGHHIISKYGLPSAGFPQAALRSSFFMITTAFIAGCSFFCPSTASSIFSKIPFRFQEIRTINLLFHFFFYRSWNMLLWRNNKRDYYFWVCSCVWKRKTSFKVSTTSKITLKLNFCVIFCLCYLFSIYLFILFYLFPPSSFFQASFTIVSTISPKSKSSVSIDSFKRSTKPDKRIYMHG